MITFYDNQAPCDANSITNTIELKSKENKSLLNKMEYINDKESALFRLI